jgi:mitochondrial fission protein ELM1
MERKVLILTDGKAGHENQSRAFARALGLDFELAPVRFKSKFHKTLSYLFDRMGLRPMWLWEFVPQETNGIPKPGDMPAPLKPSVVIGTGSGTFYPAKSLARKTGAKCAVVLYPRGYDIASFDCVLAPAFDRPKKARNVVEIPANLVASDAAFYAEGVEKFKEHYRKSTGRELQSGKAVAVIIGGPNKCSTMTPEWMKARLDEIFADGAKVERWVTTSRRTPPEVEAVVDSYPWDYRLLYSRDHFNPIPAFVSLAETLYVTAESTGMLSEACTSGSAEVVALDNLHPGPHKFRRFVEDLARGGYVDGTRKVDLSEQFARARQLLSL